MTRWTEAKCLQIHTHTHTMHKTIDMRDTPMHVHVHSRTSYTHGVPEQIKLSGKLISVRCTALGQSLRRKHITHTVASRPKDQLKIWTGVGGWGVGGGGSWGVWVNC